MGTVNWLAVILAAVVMFGFGALWYSPRLFDARWLRAAGLTEADRGRGSLPVIFGSAFVLTLIMAANLAFLLSAPEMTLTMALFYSLAAGLGFGALSIGVIAFFERRPVDYFWINGGYITIGFLLMGLVLGLWR